MGYKSNLNAVKKALKDGKRESCEAIGTFVVAEMQPRTTVKTGNLRRSETYETMPNADGVYVGVTEQAPYAIFIEKGSSKQQAQPFCEPAVMENLSQIEAIAEQKITAHMGGN